MKRFPVIASAIAVLAAGTMAAFLAGCEADPATESLTINPSSATLAAGESCTFRVTGGYEYTWSLKTQGLGSLSARKGDTTVYTAPTTATTGGVQVIQVTSTIQGTSGGTTNTASYSVSGDATVTFK